MPTGQEIGKPNTRICPVCNTVHDLPLCSPTSHTASASDVVNQFHRWLRNDTEIRDRAYRTPISPAICKDGFCVSIQASEFSYCTPRVTDDVEYSSFELGFPNMDVPELAEWKDGDGDDKGTVYGYVPVEAIVKLLEKHGGLVGTLVLFRPEALTDDQSVGGAK